MSAPRQRIEKARAESQSPAPQAAAKPAGCGKDKKAAKQSRDQHALLLPIRGGSTPKKAAENQTEKPGRKKAG
jgi:hypothetical protein